ncbi:MAG: MFS transporter [Puniceicoccales bacterium]|nr:MFS transporter [Puniceicoccales bacterium]
MLSSRVKNYAIFAIVCALVICSLPGQSMGFCAFTEPILRTTGLSRTTFSIIYMAATILGGCGILVSGKLIDYFGIRKSLLLALPLWALTLFCFGSCFALYELVHYAISWENFSAVFFLICLSMMRFLGQNVLPLLGRMQIVRTFSGSEGFAIAIYGFFVSSSRGFVPQTMRSLAKHDNWEHALRVLSLSGLALFFLILFFWHDRSEVEPVQPPLKKKVQCKQLPFVSKGQLLKTPVFWCIASALCMNEFIGTGTAIHIVDIFRERGIPENIALGSYVPLSIATVIAGFFFGKLMDLGKIKANILLMFLAQFFGLLGLDFSQDYGCVMLYALSMGTTWGAHRVLLVAAWSKIFGQEHIGEIYGIVYFLSTIAGAISVPLMSLFRHQFGSYFPLMYILQFVIILCTILCRRLFPA